MNYGLLAIPVAYILDLFLGDPQVAWHPIRIMGKLINSLEKRLNRERINKIFAGAILVILVVSLTLLCVWGTLRLSKSVHPIFYFMLSCIFIYFSLSVKSLDVEVDKVYRALKDKDIPAARKNISLLVGRDTARLDEPEIIRATVETVAESIMDGIIAPLFYAFLGGSVLASVYKAINTLDSMVGYRSERFIDFGKASAKLDGLVNFIPARLTCLLIFISSMGYGKHWANTGKRVLKYFFKGPQSNSEATEAVMASALGVQLGGLNFYNSIPMRKPLIGDNLYPLNIGHIKEGIKIAYLSSALFILIGIVFIWLIGRG